MRPEDEGRAIGDVINRITARLPGVPRATIEAVVEMNLRQFDGRPIRAFVPLLVERASIASLATHAASVDPLDDAPSSPAPRTAESPSRSLVDANTLAAPPVHSM